MQNDEVIIRSGCMKDCEFGMRLAVEQGWNPGIYDGEIIAMADPWGSFAAVVGGQTAGFISTPRFNDDFGFSGGLMVDPAFRNTGVAVALGMASLSYLNCRIVGCDSILPLQKNYEKRGFVAFYHNLRFMGQAKDGGPDSASIVDLKEMLVPDLFTYDRQMFPAPRPHFLLRWCFQPQSFSLGYVKDKKLAGYGVLRKSLQGYKIGPLFADSPVIAEELLNALASRVAGETIFIDVPEVNQPALAITANLGMNVAFETCRMYLGGEPQVPLDRIFGITSNEIG